MGNTFKVIRDTTSVLFSKEPDYGLQRVSQNQVSSNNR